MLNPFRGDNHFIGGNFIRNATVFFYINFAYRLHIGTLTFRNCEFYYSPSIRKGQLVFGTLIHEGLNPISIFHVAGNIVHIPISVPGGSFTGILGINGRGRSSSTVGVERRHSHAGFILGNGDHLTIKPTTNGTGMGIQRFNDFHHFNIQILVTFLGGNSVEIGGFGVDQSPRLIPMNPELLLNGRGDLGWGITPKKPLCQALTDRTHQIILVQPTAIPEGSPVRCPRL